MSRNTEDLRESIAKKIVSIRFRTPSAPESSRSSDLHPCQNCGDGESYKLCQNSKCEGNICRLCLLKAFEENGYQNCCPNCFQFFSHDFYQSILRTAPAAESQVEEEVRATLDSLLVAVCAESGDEQQPIRASTFEAIVERWEHHLTVLCTCGDVHGLYPEENKKPSAAALQSLLSKIRMICGACAKRQLQMLEILHRHTTGQVSFSASLYLFSFADRSTELCRCVCSGARALLPESH
jgi:hypothetical protein